MAIGMLISGQMFVMVLMIMLCAPWFHDLTRMTSEIFAGRSARRSPSRWQGLKQNWRHKGPISLLPLSSVVASMCTLVILPFYTMRYAFLAIGIPMLTGILLCVAVLPTWQASVRQGPGAGPNKRVEESFLASARTIVIMLALTALTGFVIGVGYPFPADLADHTDVRPDHFYAPLRGSLFCLAWVFIFTLIQSPIGSDAQAPLIQSQFGRDRALLKFGHDINMAGWYLFTTNLISPQDILHATEPRLTFLVSFIGTTLLRILIVTILIAVWRALQPRPGRMPFVVLICVAILMILSGRMVR